MANVKYRVTEFTPTANQKSAGMTHSWTAKVVINNTISLQEMAGKIAARTGFKSYEAQAILASFAEITKEELLESNSVVLGDGNTNMITISPSVSGSVSDKVITDETTAAHEEDPSVAIRTTALESDLTPSRLSWSVTTRVANNFSKEFATNKSAKKVKTSYTTPEDNDSSDNSGGTDLEG